MSTVRKKLICGAVFCALCIAAFAVCFASVRDIEAVTPNGVCIYNASGVGMTMGDIYNVKALKHMSALYTLGLSETESGVVSAEFRTGQEAYITYATPMDEEILPIELLSGRWMSDWNEQNESFAVIPESLAVSFFASNAPGNVNITVNGKEYTVCGVYKENRGFFAGIASDDMCHVYIMDRDKDNMEVVRLYLADKQGRDADSLQRWVNGTAMVRLDGDMTDYRVQMRLIRSLFNLELTLCAAILVILLFVVGGRLIIITHTDMGRRLWRAFAGIAVIAGAFVLLKLVLDRVYIPSAYLPRDNIFDVGFYNKKFVTWIRWINSKGVYGGIDRLIAVKSCTTLAIGGVGVVFFTIGSTKIFKGLYTAAYAIKAKKK